MTTGTAPAKRAGDALANLPHQTKEQEQAGLSPEQLLELLETAKSADEAAQLLARGAGITPFADKNALAASGERFTIRRVSVRIKGAFNQKDDGIAAIIDTKQGQQMLTFERNEGRDRFFAGLQRIIDRFGYASDWCLQRIDKKDETYFFVLVPAAFWTAENTDTIDGELVEG